VTITGDDVARPARSRVRRSTAAILALSAVVFVFVRAPLVSVPFERDEGEYAYIAQRILAGDVPYRDAFDQKPPGTFYVYAGAFALLGESLETIHLFMYAWTALTALALFGCVRRLSGELAAAFAVLVFASASAEPRLTGNAANTEIFMLLPLVASFYCLLRGLATASGVSWWLACGALAAGACWFKQVAVTNALYVAAVPALVALSGSSGGVRAGLLRAYGGLAAGALLATVPGLLALAAAGAW
jgi:4-amino-4-deoxy-L-arabinose transferase-like glycosyltransferase